MSRRAALFGAIAALTIASPSHAVAQDWSGGWGGGWGGGVTVNVGFPAFRRPDICCRPFFRRPIACCRPFFQRPIACCRPFIPRPVVCCRPFFRRWARPPYFYGDSFAPYGYHYDAGYTDAAYDGYDDGGYGDGEQ
jgi:hypothetical protein